MKIYAYLIQLGAGFQIQCLHRKIMCPGGEKKEKNNSHMFLSSFTCSKTRLDVSYLSHMQYCRASPILTGSDFTHAAGSGLKFLFYNNLNKK